MCFWAWPLTAVSRSFILFCIGFRCPSYAHACVFLRGSKITRIHIGQRQRHSAHALGLAFKLN